MRNHIPWISLALAFALASACGGTGPGTHSGLTACDQLRECACDPSRTTDVAGCNQMVDNLMSNPDPERTCALRLQVTGCGRGIQVNPPGF